MKELLLKISLFGTLMTLVGCTSDIDTFIVSLKEGDIKTITITDKSSLNGQTIVVKSLRVKKHLYKLLKQTTKIDLDSVMPRLHNRFYIITICTRQPNCQEIELIRTNKGQGIINAYVSSHYLQNDALLPAVDSLLTKQTH